MVFVRLLSIITKDDKEMMQDLVVAAVNKALENVDVKAKEEIKKRKNE